MPQLHIENLSKSFGRRRVLSRFELTAEGGEVVGVVGGNGSGKSTLLKIVAGLVRPSAGSVRLHVENGSAAEGAERRRLVGYMSPDLLFYPELSARENLAFFSRVGRMERTEREIADLLARVGLKTRADDPVAVFSSGMKQRLRLAFALLNNASVLLLDEPSIALDRLGVALVAAVVEEMREQGKLVLLATNDPDEVAWTDRQAPVGQGIAGGASVGLAE